MPTKSDKMSILESENQESLQNSESYHNLYIITGPRGAGKTAVSKLLENVIKKATTREPRPGEISGVDYDFLTLNEFWEKRNLFSVTYPYPPRSRDNYYGVYKNPTDQIYKQRKKDGILTQAGFEALKELLHRYPYAIPILLFTDKKTEEERLRSRGTSPGQIKKILEQNDKERILYRDNSSIIKYFIRNDSPFTYLDEEGTKDYTRQKLEINDIANLIKKIIKRENSIDGRSMSFSEYHKQYADELFSRLFGGISWERFIKKVSGNGKKPTLLYFDKEVLERYSDEKKIALQLLKPLQERKIVSATKVFGRYSIFLEKCGTEYNIEKGGEKSILLDLIELKAESKFRRRNDIPTFDRYSSYGLIDIPGLMISDGGIFTLKDDFTPLREGTTPYALNIGFVNISEGYIKVEPLDPLKVGGYKAEIKSEIETKVTPFFRSLEILVL
jgi:guanylate kinase